MSSSRQSCAICLYLITRGVHKSVLSVRRRRRVTISLRALLIGFLHFLSRITREQLIDIKSLLCTSGGFKEERASKEKNCREVLRSILILKASDFLARVRSGVLLSSIKIQCRLRRSARNNTQGRIRRETRGDDHLRFTPSERFDGTLVRDSRRGKKKNVLLEEFLLARSRRGGSGTQSAFRFLDSVKIKGKRKASVKKKKKGSSTSSKTIRWAI